jgi:arginase family enzyme
VLARLGNSLVVGADVVELNPDRDLNGVTAMVAAKIAKELAALLAR